MPKEGQTDQDKAGDPPKADPPPKPDKDKPRAKDHELNALKTQMRDKQKEIDELKEKLRTAEAKECPSCGTVMQAGVVSYNKDNDRSEVAELRKQLEEANTELAKLREQADAAGAAKDQRAAWTFFE